MAIMVEIERSEIPARWDREELCYGNISI